MPLRKSLLLPFSAVKKPTAACFLRCPALWFAGCQCPYPGRLWYRFASWLSHHYYLWCQYLQDLHLHWRCLSLWFLHLYLLAGRRRNCKAIKPILLLEILFSLLSVLLFKNPIATADIQQVCGQSLNPIRCLNFLSKSKQVTACTGHVGFFGYFMEWISKGAKKDT